jgi:hypothetical protein
MRVVYRIVAALVAGFLPAFGALAGPATLDANELPALRDLVARDKAAATQFDAVRSAADAALADKPQPVERIISAGKLESDPDKVRTTAALKDFDKASALAWAWAVTGDERYARKGREFIAAWARVNRTDGNPINETKLEPLIEAYDLLRGSFDADGRARIDRWLDDRAMAVWNDPQVRRENWQSHRLKVVGMIAATTGSESLWLIADKGFKDQIGTNFDASGESVDFKRRDALHYHLYAVQPLLTLACVAQSKGERLFDYQASNGATLRESVEFVEPFATGRKKHMEFADSEVSFDRKRGAAGEKSFAQKPWSPRASIRLFAEAGCLDPTYDKLATEVAGSPRSPYVSWRSVLNAVETSRPRK